MDINELKKYGLLMKELQLSAFEVSEGGKTFRMERGGAAPVATQAVAAPAYEASSVEASCDEPTGHLVEFKSQMVGVFYSSSAEDKEDFVKVGSQFSEGDTLCIIEAMKLMNEIKAEEDGVIEKILVKSGDAVEYGTPLFLYRRVK